MGTKSTTNQTNEGEMGNDPVKVYKLDAVGHNTLQIIPNGNSYILIMNTSNGYASVVVDKSRLLWLADFIYKTIGEK